MSHNEHHQHQHQHHHHHNHHHHHGSGAEGSSDKTDDVFAERSADYDDKASRHETANTIAKAITQRIPALCQQDEQQEQQQHLHIMDFGAGTGLLTQGLLSSLLLEAGSNQKQQQQYHVAKITAVDTSPSMLQVFSSKEFQGCETETILVDEQGEKLDKLFVPNNDDNNNNNNQSSSSSSPPKLDGIVSSMTLHHVQDVPTLLGKMYQWIHGSGGGGGGFIALADLDLESGSFHDESHRHGVHHYGFDREQLETWTRQAGFVDITIETVHVISKQVENGHDHCEFPIFLLTAIKRPL